MLDVIFRIIFILIILALIVACFRTIRKESKKTMYSYHIVSVLGVMVFLVLHLGVQFILLRDSIQYMSYFDNSLFFYSVLTDFLNGFTGTIIVAFIPAVLFSIVLLFSNIVLYFKEGRSFTNTLAILSSIVLVFGSFLVIFMYDILGAVMDVHSYLGHHISLAIENIVAIVLIYFECMMAATVFTAIKSMRHKTAYDKKYIIVLGCGVREDGLPGGVLRKRIEAAINFAHKQKHNTKQLPTLIFSGGKGSDEPISEAESMQKYAIAQKYEGKILLEKQSTTTHENFKFSKKLIKDTEHVAFATTDFHIFRSGVFATKLGYKHIEGIGSKSPWYFYYNALMREFIANLNAERKMHIFNICVIIAFIVTILIITYNFDLL